MTDQNQTPRLIKKGEIGVSLLIQFKSICLTIEKLAAEGRREVQRRANAASELVSAAFSKTSMVISFNDEQTRAAFEKSWRRVCALGTAMQGIPARNAAMTPFSASSKTIHSEGAAPALSAAARKISGAGLTEGTSNPLTTTLK